MGQYCKEKYDLCKNRLKEMGDEKYREIHGSLIPGMDREFWGVRVPLIRKAAKEVIRGDWRGFLEQSRDETVYEMVMLSGMVTAKARCDFEEKLEWMERFIPRIDNWAVCDVVCGEFKDVKKYRERMFSFLQPCLASQKEYELRFAVVILMQYYLVDEWIERVLDIYESIRHEAYYVKMAVAWGISLCFVKYRDRTLEFLHETQIDSWTYNKALQKARESRRVSAEDKEMLKDMKRPVRSSEK